MKWRSRNVRSKIRVRDVHVPISSPSFNGVTHKHRFESGTLFLLLQPRNALFHRDCGALCSLAAKTINISGLGEVGSKLD